MHTLAYPGDPSLFARVQCYAKLGMSMRKRFSAAGGLKGMQCNLHTTDLHVYIDVMG